MLSTIKYKINNNYCSDIIKKSEIKTNSNTDNSHFSQGYTDFHNLPLNYFSKVSFREMVEKNFAFDFDAEPVVKQEAAKLYEILAEHFSEEEKSVKDSKKLANLKQNHKKFMDNIYCTIKYAYNKHKGQFREGGDPYIVHPIGVAKIVCDNGNFNISTVKAALLHDTVEDTCTKLTEIDKTFGGVTAKIVDGVTKIEKVFESKQEKEDHNLSKIMLAVADEPRVAFVKLADRIFNMRTMDAMPPEKQKAKAEETLKIYVPLAERLGMKSTRVELENLSLKYYDPNEYDKTLKVFERFQQEAKSIDGLVKSKMIPELRKMGINAQISLQPKSYYRVYQKMQQGKVPALSDLYSLKLIVPDYDSCYSALRILTEKFTILDGSIKYYIQNPKENLYKSLHARIVTDTSQIQVQIRTPDMQRYLEKGFSAFLQDRNGYNQDEFKLSWIENIREYEKLISKDLDKIAAYLEKDILSPQIHIVTEGHKTIDMPKGSTATDFAFRINKEAPWNMEQAKVNGVNVPFDYILKKGDIVSVTFGDRMINFALLQNKVTTQFAKDLIEQKILRG